MRHVKHIIFALIITSFGINSTVNAQEYSDTLEPVYLSQILEKTNPYASLIELNNDLLAMDDINFGKEIRSARKQNTQIAITETNVISKANYLKVLRAAANKTEDISSFYDTVYNEIPSLEQIKLDEGTVSKLYITVKSNTLHGKLEQVGFQLTWL